MKRNILFIMLILGLAVLISAQERETRNQRNWQAPETVTVSGSMVVARGGPALKSGDVTYIVSGIGRLIGFVDGLKEGAQVTVEGVAVALPRNDDIKLLRASKLTIGGKTYDIEPLFQGQNFGHMMGPMSPWGGRPRSGPQGPQRYPWPAPQQRPNLQRPTPRNPQQSNRL